ncbi:MAG TPA: cytochrome P450 [Thermoanaerobaculia bacterium]|nr:cytochrome P450 [Thermoanaerobaculia bacterium]
MRSSAPLSVREVPGPRGYPLVGALPKVRKDPLQFLVQVARQYGDLVCLGGVGNQKFFLVNHPRDIEHVLKTNHRNYTKGTNFKLIKSFAGEGLFLSEGDFWRSQRKLVQPAFHVPRLAALATSITSATEAAVERWLPRAGQPRDVEHELMHLSLEISVRTLFGSDVAEDADAVRKSVSVAFSHLHEKVWSLAPLPLWMPTPSNLRFQRAVASMDEVVYRIIRDRRRSGAEGNDVLSMLLAVRDENGERMPDRQVRDEVVTMLVAGHESTAITLAWTLALLSRHPDIERRVCDELDGTLGGRTPTFSDLPGLSYLGMVLKESMRLYPAFWMFTRTPVEDDEVGGHTIPAGSVLLFSSYVTHRRADFWPNPEAVDPERFTPERIAERPAFSYLPFGGGPRQCIGMRLAEFQTQLMLATILQRFGFHLVPGRRLEPEATLSLRPKGGLWMTLHERANIS